VDEAITRALRAWKLYPTLENLTFLYRKIAQAGFSRRLMPAEPCFLFQKAIEEQLPSVPEYVDFLCESWSPETGLCRPRITLAIKDSGGILFGADFIELILNIPQTVFSLKQLSSIYKIDETIRQTLEEDLRSLLIDAGWEEAF
jgi:hypothetical protein